MASKGRPYRSTTLGEFDVLIGKGARDNDNLSLRIARRGDTWLHVGGGTPGSHVVIQNPDRRELPREVLERAAALAAWYSKARDRGLVEAINAIQSDFDRIIVITHIDELKDAFPARIQVTKTADGSQIEVV